LEKAGPRVKLYRKRIVRIVFADLKEVPAADDDIFVSVIGEILILGLFKRREGILLEKRFHRLIVQFYPMDEEVQSMKPKEIF
jgi:hypothetical protein